MKKVFIVLLLSILLINYSFAQQKQKNDSVVTFVQYFQSINERYIDYRKYYKIEKDYIVIIDSVKNKKLLDGKFYGFDNVKDIYDYTQSFSNYRVNKNLNLDKNNKKGAIIWYYKKNQNPKKEITYISDKKNISQYWNKNGKELLTNGSGMIENSSDKRNEIMIVKDSIITESYIIRFKKNDTIYYKVDIKAMPKKGINDFRNQIARTTDLSNLASDLGVSGRVNLRFVVNKKGKLEDFTIVSKSNVYYNQAVVKTFKKLPNWKPAYFKDKPVKMQFSIPIIFQVED